MRIIGRLTAVALAAALVLLGTPQQANADHHAEGDDHGHVTKGLEVGGFLGAHLFNSDNEIGVLDGDGRDHPEDAFAFGFRLAYAVNWLLSFEGEVSMMPTTASAGDENIFAVGWRAHALVHLLPGKFQPFVLFGGGALSAIADTPFEEDSDAQFHTGLGVRYWLGHDWGLRADARLLFPPSTQDDFVTTDWEFTLGIYKYFGKKDKKAPPPPPADTDGDGLTDDVDQCPQEPEDKDNFQDEDGCPDNDNDNDGIDDVNDKCPDVAEDKNGIDDEDGCPEKDEDGDGLVGTQDRCPTEPEDKDGFDDEDGCPDTDNDNDGIADADDKCPGDPETVNQYEDQDGCPDEVPKEVQKFSGAIEGIKFQLGSAKIRRSSNKVLDEAIEILKKYPDIKLEIQGHTDSTGSEEVNNKLSQSRADSVRKYMVDKGIAEDRLTAKGYGPSVAVGDNKTKAGRAKNRRVEFKRQ